MEFIKKHKEAVLIGLILLLAAILRFYHYHLWSLSNDELSALNRLQFDNLKDLVKNGVMLNDMHPAGVQVFLFYWTKLFGISEASVRFPFIVAGLLSIVFIYLIAARWFSRATGLFAAAAFAVIEYTILYSQLARPYSPGLLFSLSAVYFWTRVLFDKEKKIVDYIALTLSYVFAAYTHNFAFLFIIIVGLTGLLFLKKDYWKAYIASALLAAILYLPHIKIFFHQFGIGGVGGWLSKPDNTWLPDYLYYVSNYSLLLLCIVGIIFFFSVGVSLRTIKITKFHFISFLWFFGMFYVAYFYSIFRNPILQKSILLFTFPFLVIFIFSFVDSIKRPLKIILILCLCVGGSYSTVKERLYYKAEHFGDFKGLAKSTIAWNKKFGYDNITRTINVVDPYYIKYYINKFNVVCDYSMYSNNGSSDLLKLKILLNKSETPYFIYGWEGNNPPTVEDIIMEKYPFMIKFIDFGFAKNAIYGRDSADSYFSYGKPERTFSNSFEGSDLWNTDSSMLVTNFSKDGVRCLKFDADHEFGATFNKKVNDIFHGQKNIQKIKIKLWANTPTNDMEDVQLVVSLENKGQGHEWRSEKLSNYLPEKNKWESAFMTFKMPKVETSLDEDIKIYVWNPKRKTFYIDWMYVAFYPEILK